MVEVQKSDLLVEDLGEDVDTNVHALDGGLGWAVILDLGRGGALFGLVCAGELDVLLGESLVARLVQHDLGKDLVGEGARHDEGRVTSGAAKVDETTLGQEDEVTAVWHQETVNLGLDADTLLGVLLEPGNVDLNVEVTDVADDGVLRHNLKVLPDKNVPAAGGGNEDLTDRGSLLHSGDLEARDGGLESVDGVNLSDEDAGTHGVEGLGTTLANVTETGDDGNLACNHDVGGTLDAVDERLAAAVEVVELALGHAVVDVDGRHQQTVLLALVLEHLVEVVDTGSGLFGDTVAALEHLGVLGVDESGQVTAIVEDQVEALAGGESLELLLQAPVVLFLSLALPGEDGSATSGNSSGGVVLGGEDVARGPGDFSAEGLEGLDEDGGLDGCLRALV